MGAPATLPADFNQWDKAPETLPANFDKWDQPSHADVMHGEIKAAPGGLTGWLNDLEGDLRYGTSRTLPGKILAGMGAPGLNRGTSEGTAEQMGAVPLGLTKAAQGVVETPEHPVAGPLKAASGLIQAASPAMAFMAPEAAEGISALPAKVSPGPMKEAAGKLFASVAEDANKVPVTLENSHDAALRLMDWQRKTQLGPTLNKFLNRITSGKQGPLTYEEGRDFYSLLTKMSVDEATKLAPPVKFQVQRLAVGLKQDIGNAADQVGRAADYYKAMGDYAHASRLQEWYDLAKKYAIRAGLAAAGGGAAATGAKFMQEGLQK